MATDRYEEWKEQGRPGGSYANWMADQEGREAPNQPAQPAPAAPAANTSVPAPGGNSAFETNLNVFNATPDFKDTNISQGQWDAWTAEERAKAGGRNANNTPNKYNPDGKGCPPNLPYTSRGGPNGEIECAAKPDDCPEGSHVEGTPGKCVQNGTGHEAPGAFGGNQGGANGGGPPPPPPKPVTFGNQLSMSGNPLQDMLIQQFNTGQDPTTMQNNIFGLGEDARVGGTGVNADQGNVAPTRQGQNLGGGGLWWGQTKDTFSGFDASQKNAEGAATVSPAAREAQPTPAAPTITPAVATAPGSRGTLGGMYQGGAARNRALELKRKPTPMAGMMTNAFQPSYK